MKRLRRTVVLLLLAAAQLACTSSTPRPADAAARGDARDRDLVTDANKGTEERSSPGDGPSRAAEGGPHDALAQSDAQTKAGNGPFVMLHISDLHFGDSATIAATLGALVEEVLPALAPDVTINSGDTTDSARSPP